MQGIVSTGSCVYCTADDRCLGAGYTKHDGIDQQRAPQGDDVGSRLSCAYMYVNLPCNSLILFHRQKYDAPVSFHAFKQRAIGQACRKNKPINPSGLLSNSSTKNKIINPFNYYLHTQVLFFKIDFKVY